MTATRLKPSPATLPETNESADHAAELLNLAGPAALLDRNGTVIHANPGWITAAAALLEPATADIPQAVAELHWRSVIHELEHGEQGVERVITSAIDDHSGSHRLQLSFRATDTTLQRIASFGREISSEATRRAVVNARTRLEDIARLVSDWLWECDADLRVTNASARTMHALGRHPMELKGLTLTEIGTFQTDFGTGAPCDPPSEVAAHTPFRDAPFVATHRDGTTRLFKISGVPVFAPDSGRYVGYRGTAHDVTAEVQARHLERRTHRRLIDAIEVITDGFALFDENEQLIFANSRLRQIYPASASLLKKPGTPMAAVIRAGTRERLGDRSEAEIDDWLQERLEHIRSGGIEFDLDRNGSWLRIRDYRTPDGDIVSVRTDITELKEREAALMSAKEEAEIASRAKSDFLANMSHELRTPLNAIIGFAEIIHDELFGAVGNDRYKQYVGDILDSGRHLLNIINDILDVSKAEAGKLELLEDTIPIPDVVASAIRLVQERASQNTITIRENLVCDLPVLFADQRKIKQILLNLLSNAVKFTPPGGTVTVSAHLAKSGDLVLSIADTGIGMDSEQIGTALTPFGQIDSAFNRSHEGTGLGLPLCLALVELHGGTLEIESAPDRGTTARVSLPAARLEFL